MEILSQIVCCVKSSILNFWKSLAQKEENWPNQDWTVFVSPHQDWPVFVSPRQDWPVFVRSNIQY